MFLGESGILPAAGANGMHVKVPERTTARWPCSALALEVVVGASPSGLPLVVGPEGALTHPRRCPIGVLTTFRTRVGADPGSHARCCAGRPSSLPASRSRPKGPRAAPEAVHTWHRATSGVRKPTVIFSVNVRSCSTNPFPRRPARWSTSLPTPQPTSPGKTPPRGGAGGAAGGGPASCRRPGTSGRARPLGGIRRHRPRRCARERQPCRALSGRVARGRRHARGRRRARPLGAGGRHTRFT